MIRRFIRRVFIDDDARRALVAKVIKRCVVRWAGGASDIDALLDGPRRIVFVMDPARKRVSGGPADFVLALRDGTHVAVRVEIVRNGPL